MSKTKTVTVITSHDEQTGTWSAACPDVDQFGQIAAKDAETLAARICQAISRVNGAQLELDPITEPGEIRVKVAA